MHLCHHFSVKYLTLVPGKQTLPIGLGDLVAILDEHAVARLQLFCSLRFLAFFGAQR
jgi:hypothetical protein